MWKTRLCSAVKQTSKSWTGGERDRGEKWRTKIKQTTIKHHLSPDDLHLFMRWWWVSSSQVLSGEADRMLLDKLESRNSGRKARPDLWLLSVPAAVCLERRSQSERAVQMMLEAFLSFTSASSIMQSVHAAVSPETRLRRHYTATINQIFTFYYSENICPYACKRHWNRQRF